MAARFGSGPVVSYGTQAPRRRHIRDVLHAEGDTVIPPFHDDDGTDGSALQYEVFMNAKRALPPPVSAAPFNPGMGSQYLKTMDGVPSAWPSPDHDKFSTGHHLSAFMQDVCQWAFARAIRPEQTMEILLTRIGDKDTQAVLRQALAEEGGLITRDANGLLQGDIPEVFETFYKVVQSHLRHLVPEYGEVLGHIASLKLEPSESVISFYVRMLNLSSLLVNALDYREAEFRFIASDFKYAFVSALDRSSRDLTDAPDLQYKAHPRQKWAKYDLWDLVWTNHVYSKKPAQHSRNPRPSSEARHAHQVHVVKRMRRDEKREERSGQGERLAPRPMEVEYDAEVKQWADLSSKMREILRRYCAELRKLQRAGAAISEDAKDVRRLKDQMDKQATHEGITIAVCTKCAKYGHATYSRKCPQEA